MKILIIVFNNFTQDNRVERQAVELAEAGHQVQVLALHKLGLNLFEKKDTYEVFRLPSKSVANLDLISEIYNLKLNNLEKYQDLLEAFYNSTPFAEERVSRTRLQALFHKFYTLWEIKNDKEALLNAIARNFKIIIYPLYKRHKQSKFLKLIFGPLEFKWRRNSYNNLGLIALEFAKYSKPEFVLANDFNGLLAAELIKDSLNINYAYDSHELWSERNRPLDTLTKHEKEWEKISEERAMKKSDLNITVCKSISNHLSRIYGIIPPIVVRNTPNCIDNSLLTSPAYNLKTKLNISSDSFLLIYIGKVTFNRGVEDILEAIKDLDETVQFATMGYFDETFQKIFRKKIKQLGVENQVHMIPAVKSHEVPLWASSADLSLTTTRQACLSYYYALPNKVFESIQAHLPVIAPNSPEFEYIINKYKCGLTYKDADPMDLKNKIELIKNNKTLKIKLVEGSRKASNELVWDKERIKFLNHIQGVVTTLK
jgi:glycosyltransferase involved in cell wall biosynthesis